jgi:hydrogenase expression/formation protein HypC
VTFVEGKIMCLAIPAEIISIENDFANANFDGIEKKIIIALVPHVKIGEYVIVHAGMAIQILDAKEAQASLNLWREMVKDNLVDKADYV